VEENAQVCTGLGATPPRNLAVCQRWTLHPRLQQLMAVHTAPPCCMLNWNEARIAPCAKPAVPSDVLDNCADALVLR
jgi:hypothetical protein